MEVGQTISEPDWNDRNGGMINEMVLEESLAKLFLKEKSCAGFAYTLKQGNFSLISQSSIWIDFSKAYSSIWNLLDSNLFDHVTVFVTERLLCHLLFMFLLALQRGQDSLKIWAITNSWNLTRVSVRFCTWERAILAVHTDWGVRWLRAALLKEIWGSRVRWTWVNSVSKHQKGQLYPRVHQAHAASGQGKGSSYSTLH